MDSILIMHQGAIGDLILSLPSFHSLRKTFSGSTFEVMGYPRILSLLHQRFYADTVASIEQAGIAALYQEDSRTGKEITAYFRRFRKLFIFGGNAQKVAVDAVMRMDGPEVYHIKTFPEGMTEHITDYQLGQLALRGFDTDKKVPEIYLRQDDIRHAQEFLGSRGGINLQCCKLAAFHPGSGSPQKNWPAENLIALIKTLFEKLHLTPLIIEGPADENTVKKITEALGTIPAIVLKHLELPLLASILLHCRVFVGNDSGISHLSAAAGINTAVIFGPTDPHIWGPRGRDVLIMRDEKNQKEEQEWVQPEEVLEHIFNKAWP